jgi:hypothetical protein
MEHSIVAPPSLFPHRMEHDVATPLILSTLPMAVKHRFLILNFNMVLVYYAHCPRAPIVPLYMHKNMDYGEFPTYIKSKLVYLWHGLCYYLQIAQSKWWVVVWSSMKLENAHTVIHFIFKRIKSLCMVLG